MYILEDVSYYGYPDTLFDLCSWLFHVSDDIQSSMKKALYLDLEKIVDAYQDEPAMNNVLRNISRFMAEELLPYIGSSVGGPFENNGQPTDDGLLAHGYEECPEGAEDDWDEEEYYTPEEYDELSLRKSSPLRFDKLSVISEASLDDSVFIEDEIPHDDDAKCLPEDAVHPQPMSSSVADIDDDQPLSVIGDEDHPDDPKNSLCRTLGSSTVESDLMPGEDAPKRKSLRNRLTNLVRRVTMTMRRQFGTP